MRVRIEAKLAKVKPERTPSLDTLKLVNNSARVRLSGYNRSPAGHIQGSLNNELGELTEHLYGLPRELPIVVLCASGMRVTIADSILRRNGRDNIRVVGIDGAPQWIARGYPSAIGDE